MTIYIKIINEDIEVYRPVKALKLQDDTYKIIQKNLETNELYGEIWEFNKNDIVMCDNKLRAIKKGTK